MTVKTATPSSAWAPLLGTSSGATSDAAGSVTLTVPALGAVLLRADAQIPAQAPGAAGAEGRPRRLQLALARGRDRRRPAGQRRFRRPPRARRLAAARGRRLAAVPGVPRARRASAATSASSSSRSPARSTAAPPSRRSCRSGSVHEAQRECRPLHSARHEGGRVTGAELRRLLEPLAATSPTRGSRGCASSSPRSTPSCGTRSTTTRSPCSPTCRTIASRPRPPTRPSSPASRTRGGARGTS